MKKWIVFWVLVTCYVTTANVPDEFGIPVYKKVTEKYVWDTLSKGFSTLDSAFRFKKRAENYHYRNYDLVIDTIWITEKQEPK